MIRSPLLLAIVLSSPLGLGQTLKGWAAVEAPAPSKVAAASPEDTGGSDGTDDGPSGTPGSTVQEEQAAPDPADIPATTPAGSGAPEDNDAPPRSAGPASPEDSDDATPTAVKQADSDSEQNTGDDKNVDGDQATLKLKRAASPRPTPIMEVPIRAAAREAATASPEDASGQAAPVESRTLTEVVSPTTVASPSEIPESLAPLKKKVQHALRVYYHEPITTVEYSPWGIMHALIGFGVDTEIYAGDRRVNAIGWLCYNGPCRGMQMMYVDQGRLSLRLGPGYQGHAGQFLAMLAQSRVKTDFPLKVDGYDFTVADLIEAEKRSCRTKTELTFKLIAFSHYLPIDARWKNDLGEDWDLDRLIKEELAQPIVGAACGGTHRMTGLSYAVNKRTRSGLPFEGQWLRAQKYVQAYHQYIFKLQNADGSFSTNWFASRGDLGDENRRVQTTGHMLEWLVCSLTKEELDDPRVIKSVDYLADLLLDGARVRKKWEIGPRGHAIHALALYNERRFGDKAGSRDETLARRPAVQAGKLK